MQRGNINRQFEKQLWNSTDHLSLVANKAKRFENSLQERYLVWLGFSVAESFQMEFSIQKFVTMAEFNISFIFHASATQKPPHMSF